MPLHPFRLALLACFFAIAADASAALPYYLRVTGTPSAINCGATTFFMGPGGFLSWSLMNGSQLTVDATAYINGAAQGSQSFTLDRQVGSAGLEAINQASISYPSQTLPYTLAVDIVPRDPYTDGVRIAFTCTSSGGTGFSATVIPGADANLQVSPPSLSFPATTVGATTAPQSATVTNTGNVDATGVTVGTGGSLDFALSGTTCGTTIAQGTSCTVSVTFSPKAAGLRTATVTVARDFGAGASLAVGGTGLAQLAIPAQVVFGSQPVGTTSALQTLTVTNTSSATTVTVASVTSSRAAEFPVTTTCAVLAPSATCTIGVAFAPATAGARTATITVASDGVGSPQAIAASGFGLPGGNGSGQLSLPATLAFADQAVGTSSVPRVVTATNTGSAPVSVTGITSAAPAEFALSANTCTTVLPGALCTFSVTFTPAAAGARAAAITVASNGNGSPQTVNATGNGTAEPAPGQLLLEGSLAFGTQLVGTTGAARILTVTNTGGASVSVTGAASSAPSEFAVSASTCGSLAVGASCTIGVIFTPATPGLRTAVISVTSNGAGSPQTVNASGTGVAAGQGQLAVDAVVDAGSVVVGASSAPIAITLVNVGSAPVEVAGIGSGNPGEFAIVASDCVALAPGATCTFSVVFAPAAAGSRSAIVTITSNGAGSPQVVTLTGTGVQLLDVIEYYHAEWDHYFMTGIADEIVKLDNGTFKGWARTGLKFKAWPLGTSGAAVCRFFSTAFGERSSHFYTPLAAECEIVKHKPEWQFEGEVFGIVVPNGDGTCPAGTAPVYRLYNDGQGGAPNHRYTIELAVRAQMIARGWIAEGFGTIGVIMCAPVGPAS